MQSHGDRFFFKMTLKNSSGIYFEWYLYLKSSKEFFLMCMIETSCFLPAPHITCEWQGYVAKPTFWLQYFICKMCVKTIRGWYLIVRNTHTKTLRELTSVIFLFVAMELVKFFPKCFVSVGNLYFSWAGFELLC